MRVITKSSLIFFFSCAVTFITAGQDYSIIKDFKKEWRIYQNERFERFEGREGRVSTIYFMLDATKFPGTSLRISSPEPFDLFINGQLIVNNKTILHLGVDSLRNAFQSSLLQVSVHQDKVYETGLQTLIQSAIGFSAAPDEPQLLLYTSFRDFAVVGMLVLLVMLIVIIRLNPKLASDYFSITRIFSMREGVDSQAYSRIAGSINILFYAYCSLMLGYYLMVVFHFLPSHYTTALSFQASTFSGAIIQWFELSFIIMMVFAAKIILVYTLSFVFGISEIWSIHFFNWVRLLLGAFGMLTIVVFLYFTVHGRNENFYVFLLSTMSWILAGWTILIILKLRRQLGHSMFHLFSYICATELIPFLITIKVLYY